MIQQSYPWSYNQRKLYFEKIHAPCAHGCTIPKAWKQPKCPLTDKWIKVYGNGILLKKRMK